MTGLAEKTKYGFQVRAKRVGGAWGEFTLPVYQMTGALADPVYVGDSSNAGATTPAIVGAVVAVIVLLLLVAIVVILYL